MRRSRRRSLCHAVMIRLNELHAPRIAYGGRGSPDRCQRVMGQMGTPEPRLGKRIESASFALTVRGIEGIKTSASAAIVRRRRRAAANRAASRSASSAHARGEKQRGVIHLVIDRQERPRTSPASRSTARAWRKHLRSSARTRSPARETKTPVVTRVLVGVKTATRGDRSSDCATVRWRSVVGPRRDVAYMCAPCMSKSMPCNCIRSATISVRARRDRIAMLNTRRV